MKYVVKMNGKYMNCFKRYGEARDFADDLRRRYRNADVEITEM